MKKAALIAVILIVLFVIVGAGILMYNNIQEEKVVTNISATGVCQTDSDCVPASCCHPSACVYYADAPKCVGILCTQECVPGTLDCGQGDCKCLNNECTAIIR